MAASSSSSKNKKKDTSGSKRKKASSSSSKSSSSGGGAAAAAENNEPPAAAAAEEDVPDSPWFVSAFGGKMSDSYIQYMLTEWGWEKRGDGPLFEKLCLEGQQAGLSWATILAKRDNYRRAFHGFDVARCAAMTSDEIDALLAGDGEVIRHRGKLESIPHNARAIQALCADAAATASSANSVPPEHGYFDDFLWSFVGGAPRLNELETFKDMPSKTPESEAMSKALKKLGFKFVGPTTCYALMQSCGLVVDHLKDTPEWRAARDRIAARGGGPTTSGATSAAQASEKPPQEETSAATSAAAPRARTTTTTKRAKKK